MGAAGGHGERPRRGYGAAVPIVGERFCRASEQRNLTVQKTSLFYPGDGFAVYEHHHRCDARNSTEWEGGKAVGDESGELVFRVDSYDPDPHHYAMGKRGAARGELFLMGPDGDCILTVRRKWPSLHQRWEGFLGERAEGQGPLFSIRRQSIIGRSAGGIGVEVYGDQLGGGTGGTGHLQYQVEGSFAQRCCAVYEVKSDRGAEEVEGEEEGREGTGTGGTEAVAQIKRKLVPLAAADASSDDMVVLGRDVFCLQLAPGFDAAFAMGLVLVLDRITGNDGGNGRDEELSLGQPPAREGEGCTDSGSLLLGSVTG